MAEPVKGNRQSEPKQQDTKVPGQSPAAASNQLNVPVAGNQSPPQNFPSHLSYSVEGEKYLLSKGWVKVSTNDVTGRSLWNDPNVKTDSEMKTVALIPSKEGKPQELRQLHVPPSQWDYGLEEAVFIQREREAKVLREASREPALAVA